MLRALIDFFQKHPLVEAICQVLLTVFAALFPIFCLAWIHAKKNTEGKYLIEKEFSKYFESGELSLPILTVIGLLIFLLITKFNRLNAITGFICAVVLFGSIIFTSLILGYNPSFAGELESRLTWSLWVIYFGVNAAWIFLLWMSSASPPAIIPPPEQEKSAAKKLVQEARG